MLIQSNSVSFNNKKRGVTLIFLVIIVITIGIIAGIVGYNGINDINETKLLKFANELKSLEVLCNEYKIRNNGDLDFLSIDIDISGFDSEKLFQFGEESINNGYITLYKIDMNKVDAIDTMLGNGIDGEEDIYLVSSTTGNVYYLKGYTIAENTYYMLTEELKNLI